MEIFHNPHALHVKKQLVKLNELAQILKKEIFPKNHFQKQS